MEGTHRGAHPWGQQQHNPGASDVTCLSLFFLSSTDNWSDLSGLREDCLAEQYRFCDQVSLVDDTILRGTVRSNDRASTQTNTHIQTQ